jgi:L-threonylcarbamoyladenylate synthase
MPASITIDIHQAADVLRKGGLVAIPTETVYGLGGNAMDEEAISGIFAAKNRPSFDPLIIHQSSPERILTYATEVPEDAKKLARAFWPGPLTLVLPKVPQITDLVTAGLPTVALRVPAHPLTRQLLELLDFPVAAPSANPFGFVSPVTAQHVADQLAEKIDLILDGGACQVGLESTIVGFPGERPPS